MDGRRVRAATTLSRAWRNRPAARSRKLSRMSRWRAPGFNSPGNEYRFVRTCSSNGSGNGFLIQTDALGVPKFVSGATSGTSIAVDFSLQQFRLSIGGSVALTSVTPDYAEFTALFDQWCIDKVEVSLIPTFSNAGIGSNALTMLQTIIHATDDDDSTASGALVLQQYANAKYTQLLPDANGNRGPLRVFRPKPAIAAYQTGVTFAYGELTRGPKWIDVAYPTVPHYSFKAAIDSNTATGTSASVICYLDLVVRYHYKFKTVR